MREWSPFGLQGFSCLLPILGYALCILLPLQGSFRLIDLSLKGGDASLCWAQWFDGFDCAYFPDAHIHIYAETVSIPPPA
jgi:hypothetical protein